MCWVADCEICAVPMVVWRQHGASPTPEARAHMVAALGQAADAVLGPGTWTLDDVMRQIPDHFHAHARDPGWWVLRAERSAARLPSSPAGGVGGAGGGSAAGTAGGAAGS